MKYISLEMAVFASAVKLIQISAFSAYSVAVEVRKRVNAQEWAINSLPEIQIDGKSTYWIDVESVRQILKTLESVGTLKASDNGNFITYQFKESDVKTEVKESQIIDNFANGTTLTGMTPMPKVLKDEDIVSLNSQSLDSLIDSIARAGKAAAASNTSVKNLSDATKQLRRITPDIDKIKTYINNQYAKGMFPDMKNIQSRFKEYAVTCQEYADFLERAGVVLDKSEGSVSRYYPLPK